MTVTYFVLALTFFVSVQSADWSYDDPAKWGKNFKSCDGASQSPINLISVTAKYDSQLNDFKLSGFDTQMAHTIVNNGHTVQLNINYMATAQDGGLPGTFKALQFHFHWSANKLTAGSEHTMNGKAHPLEVHIVHMNTAYGNVSEALKHPDGLAVLGFFFKVGDANPAIGKFINKVPAIDKTASSEAFSISDLLGSLGGLDDYYRYKGSLTTPPCSEAVVWTVFDKFLTVSHEQLKAFWAIQDHHGHMISNYRPLQKLNGRTLYTSIKSSGMMTTAISVLVFFSVLLSANLW